MPSFLKLMNYKAAAPAQVIERVAARQHEVRAPRQCAADRERGLAAHQHGPAERQCLEALQIIRQMPWHRAFATDGGITENTA